MSDAVLIQNGRLFCPVSDIDQHGDLEIRGGQVSRVALGGGIPVTDQSVYDVKGAVVCIGFLDLHTHVGEPGFEYKEDIFSASAAAAAGGFVAICVSSQSSPVNDNRSITEHIRRRGEDAAGARMLPIATLSMGAEGKRLTEMFDLRDGGAVAFGDGERGHCDAGLMRRAMEYANAVGCPVFECPQDPHLAGVGVMHEGAVATRLGLKGIPVAAEEIAVARAVALSRQTGAPVHIGPLSAGVSVEAIRQAKRQGIPVTSSVTAAHLVLTDEDVARTWSSSLHLEPPLRETRDRDALRLGVADGTIDAISSGHRPQSGVEKDVPFGRAIPGMSGLETAFSIVMGLVDEGVLTLTRAIEALTGGPRRALRTDEVALADGSVGDVVVFDPRAPYTVSREASLSKSLNTPFLGQTLRGRVQLTFVEGRLAFEAADGIKEMNR